MATQAAEHHEKVRTMPTSCIATANRRSIMGRTRRSPLSNIMSLLAQTARQLGFFYSTIKKSAMANSGFSNSMAVAEFRYLQSLHEQRELQNPDGLVGQFLPLFRRWRCRWLSHRKIALLRTRPFYYYLVARTRYYDKIFLDAIADHVQFIINVGCGVDTRAYRFEHVLRQKGVKVLEVTTRKLSRLSKAWRTGWETAAMLPIFL